MAGITHNAYQIAARFEARGVAVEREVQAELTTQAQNLADEVRRRAPKFQSALLHTVHIASPDPFTRVVSVGSEHGIYQELGIKAGGKGLPKYSDPGSASMIAWLRAHAPSGFVGPRLQNGLRSNRRPRAGSWAVVRDNLELRDRYEGMALHIRHRGMKASPFVRPTFEAMHEGVSSALHAAVQRGMAAGGADGGAA